MEINGRQLNSLGEKVQKPTEGEWFQVNLTSIDQSLFTKAREGSNQEQARKIILEALEEAKRNPDRYTRFKTMIPVRAWEGRTVGEIKQVAAKKGKCIANWIEQALEWAQRISNGESWENLCNEADTSKWYRIVVWKNGNIKLVGGSSNFYDTLPPTDISGCDYYDREIVSDTVPLIVSR